MRILFGRRAAAGISNAKPAMGLSRSASDRRTWAQAAHHTGPELRGPDVIRMLPIIIVFAPGRWEIGRTGVNTA